jgi:hypothetical protein
MLNLAIDNKLRGCDLVRLKVEDVTPRGMIVFHAMVRERKTGLRPIGIDQRCLLRHCGEVEV